MVEKKLTIKEARYKLRCAIVRYCTKPRKMKEVRNKFQISGISAAAYLAALNLQGVLEYDRASKGFKKIVGKFVTK